MVPFSASNCCFFVFLTLHAVSAASSEEPEVCRPQPPRQDEDETSMLQTSQTLAKGVRAHSLGPDLDPSNSSTSRFYRQVLTNVDDVQYFGTMQVGSQSIKGVLDTGSFELLVFSAECRSCGSSAHGYNRSASSTYRTGHLVATHTFGSGDCDSEEGFETVQVGPFTANEQNFWEVREARMPVLNSVDFQAIIGVGPPNVPGDEARHAADEAKADLDAYEGASKEAPLSLQHQYEEMNEIADYTTGQSALLDSMQVQRFSVCFQRKDGADGYWIWNDADPSVLPQVFTALPVTGTTTWGVGLRNAQLAPKQGSSLGGLELGCAEGCGAIIDTGTSLLAVPPSVIDTVSSAMERLHEDCSNLEELPDLTFDIGGHTYTLPPDAYVGQLVGVVPDHLRPFMARSQSKLVHRCDILLMSQDSQTQFGPLWILGMPFIRHYYTTFDLRTSKYDRTIYTAPSDSQCSRPTSPALLGSNRSSTREARQGLRRVGADKLRLPPWATAAAGKFMPI
jgi:hypothetical protein